jgi:bifunctional non-homologous end joining protein LigD
VSLRPPKPMLASLRTAVPTGAGWSYEVKWDGYRTLAVKDGARVTLYSRNLKDATAQYPTIARSVGALSAVAIILDGELVAVDDDGHPSFQALHHQAAQTLAFYVFDLLHQDGRDLMAAPLAERRTELARLTLRSPILRSDPLPGTAMQIEEAVRSLGLEGIVAKRTDSRYEAGKRSDAWIKVKFQQRQELVIGGFTEDGDWVDALVVGYYERRRLMSAGKVRAGLTPMLRRELRARLLPLRTRTCPFANLPDVRSSHWGEGITAQDMDRIVWVRPQVVAEVAFTEWTRDGHLRHAAFIALRKDKSARTVIRE